MTAIGIDLGTTYSCVAVLTKNGRQVDVIANDQGNRVTPSCVAFNNEERQIGEAAKNQIARNAENTVFDVKRLIGRSFNDKKIQQDQKHWPFRLLSKGGNPKIQVNLCGKTEQFFPEQISAMVLEKMKKIAEDFLTETVSEAVITVPAYFNDGQRQATVYAAHIAKLKVLRILNEPTAAAIAFGFHKQLVQQNILVFDLGGGTFDISIMTVEDGHFRVKAVTGDTHLGGEDFDNRVVDHFVEELRKKHKIDISNNKKAMQRLRIACERAKRGLSSATSADIEIDALVGEKDYTTRLSRAKFEELNKDLFSSLIDHIKSALQEANMQKSEIDEVVLVGGSSKIVKVQSLLQEFFDGKRPTKGINPDEAVAYGAALMAAKMSGNSSDEISRLKIHDVTPLSLGISTKGAIMSTLIKRNSPIPTKNSGVYDTISDNQTSINCKIYEGENVFAWDNHFLGSIHVDGIPEAPAGEAKVDVTFSINDSGILTVTCKDQQTSKIKSLQIKHDVGRFSKEQISQMIKQAERDRERDEKRRRIVQAKNNLEQYANRINSLADSSRGEEQQSALKAYQEIVDWIETTEADQLENINSKLSALKLSWDSKIRKKR